VSLNLGDDPVVYDVSLVEVDAATLAGVWPLDVQQEGDTFRADDGVGHLAVDAFADKSIERRDYVGAASALVWVVVVAPAGILGQEPPQRVEVLVCERRTELVSNLVRSAQSDREIDTATFSRAAWNYPDPGFDQTAAIRAVDLHASERTTRRDRGLKEATNRFERPDTRNGL
jgi:hypothetical protein